MQFNKTEFFCDFQNVTGVTFSEFIKFPLHCKTKGIDLHQVHCTITYNNF